MIDLKQLNSMELAQLMMASEGRGHDRRVVHLRIDEREPLWAEAVLDDGSTQAFTGSAAYELIWRVRKESGLNTPPLRPVDGKS